MRFFYTILCLVIIVFNGDVIGQATLINAGAKIDVFGAAAPSSQLNLVVLGDFENQSDAFGNSGSIDLVDFGHMYVNGDWSNNSFSNVFSQTSVSLIDGVVTLKNINNTQVIGGLKSTFFENLNIVGSRKILSNNNNSVNNVLLVDAPLILNTNTFEIKNQNPIGITYMSGFIKSETLPGNHGYIKWNTGNYVGNFSIPFGSDNPTTSDDLRLDINLKGPMAMVDYFTFATFPADMYNQPMPSGASALETEVRKVADRYWLIEPSSKNNLPTMDIVFSYSTEDVSPTKNSINPDRLVASRNNTTIAKWLDMVPRGNSYLNTVEIKGVLPSEFFSSWTLLNNPPELVDLFTPDAFTPNGDGYNELFVPVFQVDFEVIDYELVIYNRWGKVVFHTFDKNQGWNGIPLGTSAKPFVDVYSWVVLVKGKSYNNIDSDGVKKKFVGRVTLVL